MPVEKAAQRGPIFSVIRADHGEYMVGDRARVTLEVTAPEGIEIVLPKRTETLGELRVTNAVDYAGVPVAQGRQWRREYESRCRCAGRFRDPGSNGALRGSAIVGPGGDDPGVATIG